LPKPSTRSPGCSSWSVAESSASGGFWARPESAVAPGYDKGSWRACAVWGAVYWPQVPDRRQQIRPAKNHLNQSMTMEQLLEAEQKAAKWMRKTRKIPPSSIENPPNASTA
jgi:hypothetical protein